MALIKCSECGKEISDKASSCPNCGNPILKEKIKTMKKKNFEELTPEEKNRIISYRKLKKEWWIESRPLALIFSLVGLLLIILSLLLHTNFIIGLMGCIFSIISCVIVISTKDEPKNWYEKNKDRLYEEQIIEN